MPQLDISLAYWSFLGTNSIQFANCAAKSVDTEALIRDNIFHPNMHMSMRKQTVICLSVNQLKCVVTVSRLFIVINC